MCVIAPQDRVRMACEVTSALAFLHSAPEPIIHMDLKPGEGPELQPRPLPVQCTVG
jgi:hypothetical protein